MAEPERHRFPPRNGIPNSALPLLLWKGRLPEDTREGRAVCALYESNSWGGTWVYTVYPFWHFHTQGHEVLSCVSGTATIGFGGDGGISVGVQKGDVCVIPAGVGHRRFAASDDFLMAGGYPPGQRGDIVRPGGIEPAEAARLISSLPLPATDPISGLADGVVSIWNEARAESRA
ncbi:hypothetical protein [Mesorhizobium sp. SP-1A]|uniref:hypothetical protein n=1 Tax=Mesorhizobium sp. SP-1A TaxID=3077840 RepID=UPI0028F6EBE1|nr:hypothetical protein [Mesorhizobium sp. SP-1A]